MTTKPFHCTKTTAVLWALAMLVLTLICLTIDAIVIGNRTSALFVLGPCLVSLTYLWLMTIAEQQIQIADLKRELEERKGKQL